jgi:FMNH2-dependent dimethyl sulfone monooxygenase
MGAKGQGWDYTRAMALEAEALGFDSVWLPDHVINAHMAKRTPMLENWTVLSAVAALTTKIVCAGHTFNNSFRHPAVMAKMAATFDVMFGGRLIYSLGSAWFQEESISYGLPWEDHDQRVARLREALIIAKRLWTEPEVTFEGSFYKLRNACLEPKPAQKPHIPIWVPGDSEATRRLVAEIADCWLVYSKPPEVIHGWSEEMKNRIGRRLAMAVSTVSLAGLSTAEVTRWSQLYAEERRHRFAVPPTPQDVLNENLWGSPDRCIRQIRDWQAAGVTHLIIQPIPPLEGMRFFAREIMPFLKQEASLAGREVTS